MTFDDKPAHEITDDEIRALVANRVAERQDLEFKLTFEHRDPAAKAELVRDVASMANGGGGYVLFGIREDDDNRAIALDGVQGDVKAIADSIRDLCLAHLAPRVKGLEVHRRRVDGKDVIIVRVPRSAQVPHMMTQTEGTEFWVRHGNRKVTMRYEEIREGFVGRPTKIRRPRRQKRARNTQLVQNGSFERGLQGWGTGLLEGMAHIRHVARFQGFVPFGGAVARWFVDTEAAHTGKCSLRVEHESTYSEHVFSTLSQRIVVNPQTTYEARFLVKVQEKGAGAFSLRAVLSSGEWDRFKVKVQKDHARWRPYRLRFQTDEQSAVDLRFAAEGPIKVWIDDVTVRRVGSTV